MIGTFRLEPEESLVLEFEPPDTRYWNVTLENIWHECLEPRRRHSSVTNKGVAPDADGVVRIAIGAKDFGHGHWLDTGGRHRGFIVFRWLDNPDPPNVSVTVRGSDAMSAADRFDPDVLIAQACDWAGSDDFGTDFDESETWRDGLGRLCEGLVSEARLNDLGVEIAALDVVRPLKNRLADRPMAQGPSRDRPGEDRTADLHRRAAPHRNHDPVRPARPGPAAARAADMGGRRPVSGAAARDLSRATRGSPKRRPAWR